ncbi:MAG TPA: alpha/beta hydrolase [Bryobacteraceae bacterium]|jgi:pimeloyl-ACP methyl ester carboxylesterase
MTDKARYFDSNGVKIRYLMQGEGEPVILLHGFIFSIEPAWISGGFFETLSHDNRVVALDLRGHGQSGKPHNAGSYGLQMINDVLRLIDHLAFERIHLVGYSLGAILASKFLEVAPQRLRSVVMGGAAPVREGDTTYRSWLPLAELLDRVRPGEQLSTYFWPNPSDRPPREIQQVVDANDPAALAALARGMLDVTVTDEVLRSNQVAILAICGEHDPVKPSVVAMKAVTRNLFTQVVPDLDHHTLPGSKEFRNAIRDFIRDHRLRTVPET